MALTSSVVGTTQHPFGKDLPVLPYFYTPFHRGYVAVEEVAAVLRRVGTLGIEVRSRERRRAIADAFDANVAAWL